MEMQETGMLIGAGSALFSRATAGRLGGGGGGRGGGAGLGGRSGGGGDDWRGQYSGVRQNSVAPLMEGMGGGYSRQNSVAPFEEN